MRLIRLMRPFMIDLMSSSVIDEPTDVFPATPPSETSPERDRWTPVKPRWSGVRVAASNVSAAIGTVVFPGTKSTSLRIVKALSVAACVAAPPLVFLVVPVWMTGKAAFRVKDYFEETRNNKRGPEFAAKTPKKPVVEPADIDINLVIRDAAAARYSVAVADPVVSDLAELARMDADTSDLGFPVIAGDDDGLTDVWASFNEDAPAVKPVETDSLSTEAPDLGSESADLGSPATVSGDEPASVVTIESAPGGFAPELDTFGRELVDLMKEHLSDVDLTPPAPDVVDAGQPAAEVVSAPIAAASKLSVATSLSEPQQAVVQEIRAVISAVGVHVGIDGELITVTPYSDPRILSNLEQSARALAIEALPEVWRPVATAHLDEHSSYVDLAVSEIRQDLQLSLGGVARTVQDAFSAIGIRGVVDIQAASTRGL